MLEIHCKQVTVIATEQKAKNGLQLIAELKPQIVFLDIEMPHLNGFDLLKQLEPVNFEVIFVTAHDKYILQAIYSHQFLRHQRSKRKYPACATEYYQCICFRHFCCFQVFCPFNYFIHYIKIRRQ